MTIQHLIEHCEKAIAYNEKFNDPIAQKREAEHAILLRFLKGETLADIFPEFESETVMKTIHERAHIAIGHPLPEPGVMYVPDKLKLEEQTFVNGYIQGAKDQQKLDINKAYDVYAGELTEIINTLNFVGEQYHIDKLGEILHFEECIKDFKKKME